jgi:hypothetical protein
LQLIVRRPSVETREVLDEAELSVTDGLVGDSWNKRPSSRTADGSPHPEMQINIMNVRAVALVAQDKERWQLAGDQLFIDMDLSKANLPVGSRIAIGTAILEVTSPPRCHKFVGRFGVDAMKSVNLKLAKNCAGGYQQKLSRQERFAWGRCKETVDLVKNLLVIFHCLVLVLLQQRAAQLTFSCGQSRAVDTETRNGK